jgi:serine/threonine protein phosphatase PrpC
VRLRVAGVTHRGAVRERNEDTIVMGGMLSSTNDGTPVGWEMDTTGGALVAVADGLGGHSAGDRASMLALRSLAGRRENYRDLDSLAAAIAEADAAIYREMAHERSWQGMGTTLAGFAAVGDTLWCFNVGDSRCYMTHFDSLVQVSTDDSPSRYAGQSAGATTNIVTQTLGGRAQPTVIEPHITTLPVEAGTRLLVCSDGLSDYVDIDVIQHEVLSDGALVDVAGALLRAALKAGAPDNVSVVLADIVPNVPGPAPETDTTVDTSDRGELVR